jgi:allantoinase
MPRTVLTPPAAYEAIAQAARDRNWEFMGHGFTQQNMQKVEDEQWHNR